MILQRCFAFYLDLAREKFKTTYLITNVSAEKKKNTVSRATYYSRATGWAEMRCIIFIVLVRSLGNTRLLGCLI
jgi:hypothetical protein